jgi:hypothetical protein
MRDDFLAEARSIASRLDLANSDLHTRRMAEQDMRALGLRAVARGLRSSLAFLFQRLKAAWPRRQAEITRAKPVSLHDWLL